MTGEHEQDRYARTMGAVQAATAAMAEAGRGMIGFGWTDMSDERAFLAAVDALLIEIGVQVNARGLESNNALRGLHDAVTRYSGGLHGDNVRCRCSHPASRHDVDGCAEGDTLTMERCSCLHRSGLARTQVRAWVEPAVSVAAEEPGV